MRRAPGRESLAHPVSSATDVDPPPVGATVMARDGYKSHRPRLDDGLRIRSDDLPIVGRIELAKLGHDVTDRSVHADAVAAIVTGQRCLCGCGGQAKGRFLAGHAATLHSAVLRAKKEGAHVVVSEAAAGWLMGKVWARCAYKT